MRTHVVAAAFLSLMSWASLTFYQESGSNRDSHGWDDAAVVAPINCDNAPSCGRDPTLAEIEKSFEAFKSECTKKSDCRALGLMIEKNDWCDAHEHYYWAPVNQFVDGEAALARFRQRVGTAQIFDGKVAVTGAESTKDERHLAFCYVVQVSGIAGPPRDCTTVAVITPTVTWLRGGFPSVFCNASASFRPTGAIDVSFDVMTAKGAEVFSEALMHMLTSDLRMAVEQHQETTDDPKFVVILLTSTASLRDSIILSSGWREALDFDARIESYKGQVNITGVAHVLVCRYALGSLTQYQGMDDAQRGTYAAALDSRLDGAIRTACPTYAKHDAKTIFCQ